MSIAIVGRKEIIKLQKGHMNFFNFNFYFYFIFICFYIDELKVIINCLLYAGLTCVIVIIYTINLIIGLLDLILATKYVIWLG